MMFVCCTNSGHTVTYKVKSFKGAGYRLNGIENTFRSPQGRYCYE